MDRSRLGQAQVTAGCSNDRTSQPELQSELIALDAEDSTDRGQGKRQIHGMRRSLELVARIH